MDESKIVDGGPRPTSRGARSLLATADPGPAPVSAGAVAGDRWAAAWSTSLQRPSAGFDPNWSEEGFTDQTLRQVIRLSVGGDRLRVRMSNAFGSGPLVVAAATVAASRDGGAVHPGTVRHLTVDGAAMFTIPVGAEVASDPVDFESAPLDSIAVTMYSAAPTGRATFHAQALATSYRAVGGHCADLDGEVFTETSQSWYYLSGVDVSGGPARSGGVVVFGDSQTDGSFSTPDANRRFPDRLAERLAAAGQPRAVLNQGIGGNRLTVDSAWLGEKATSRFRRDVLAQPGIGTVVILLGINDIGLSEIAETVPMPIFEPYTAVSADEVIAGHRDLIRQARAAGLWVVGATLLPANPSPLSTARSDDKRAAINAWIRTSGEYDAIVDLDTALRAPTDPDRLLAAYDSGDHLHPNDAGYLAMAAAIDPAALDRVGTPPTGSKPSLSQPNSIRGNESMTAENRDHIEVAHRTVDVNGLRMHIAEAGTGPLVLLLHGWPESWYSWRHQIPALAAAGYHVVAPDQRGYGDTDVPELVEDYTIEHLVGDITGLIDVLGEQQATVIGHDWGAIVAWEMAKMRPRRITGVAGLSIPDGFAEPQGGAATPIADLRAALGAAFYIVHFQQPGIADAAFESALEHDPAGLFRRIFRTAAGDGTGWTGLVPDGGTIVDSLADDTPTPLSWADEQDAKTYAAQYEKSGFTGGINWYRNLDRNWELSAAWRHNHVHAPALYLIGGRDGALALPQSQLLMSGGSGFRNLRETVVLPGVGHAIQQERPGQVNEVLVRFLRSL